MSSSHERDRQSLHNVPAPEVPRRIRSNHTNGNPHRHPAIREIHKNAWLKRLGASEKKGTSFIKKVEKYWVVFCVHDDVEAFLEFYTEPKMGAIHKPLSVISVNSCLHVSPSIMGQDNEYEFAVTLPTQVIRLIAANWDQMIEWVESLQGKLREMNILSPKDNLYSKLPESHGNSSCHNFLNRSQNGAVRTRDPNSPLPLPPTLVSRTTPISGAEVSRQLSNVSRDERSTVEASRGESTVECLQAVINQTGTTHRHQTESLQSQVSALSQYRNNEGIPSTRPAQQSTAVEATVDSILSQPSVLTVICPTNEVEGQGGIERPLDETELVENLLNLNSEEVAPTSSAQSVALVVSDGNNTSNTSVVQVTFDDIHGITPCKQTSSGTSHNGNNISGVSVTVLSSPATAAASVIPILQPLASSKAQSPGPPTTTTKLKILSSPHLFSTSKSPSTIVSTGQTPLERQHSAPTDIRRPNSHENIYEHLFIPSSVVSAAVAALKPSLQTFSHNENVNSDSGVANHNRTVDEVPPPAVPKRNNPHSKRLHKGNTSTSPQRSSSLSRIELQEGNTSSSGSRHHHGGSSSNQGNQRCRARHADVVRPFDSCSPSPDPATSFFNNVPTSQECRPMEAMIGVRSGEYRIRRDDVLVVGSSSHLNGDSEQDHGGTTHSNTAQTHVPLKEQQVMRLKSEIHHPGGVRIVLRKKDCVSSIAFVDYLGAVWIAGWKQQQHPVLYYAFHVGDQVLKVAGVTVQNSAEAYRAIKMVSSMQVEFIIKRLPYGRVLVLKRKKEGEPLGLVSEGNSGEIGEVVSNGLAASHGLSPNSPATDGQSTCNWFLTEINNRPLSLMAREIEVRERLNAVGKEISILVQPADLVKHLKKQLKSMKSFKEYLVC